jgi:Phytanoyl-CoA dioxygenase (PhyH)
MFFKRHRNGGGTAVAESAERANELLAEIDGLVAENRVERDPGRERRILRLRHQAGADLVVAASEQQPPHPEPQAPASANGSQLAEVSPADLNPQTVRWGMLTSGCLVIRGLVEPDEAERMVAEMERSFQAREAVGEEGTDEQAYWERFEPDPPYVLTDRDWVSSTGSIWAADSPRLMFGMLEIFERVGLRDVISGYLGERPAISVNKCTLRRVDSSAGTAWHQDGAFLGDTVRALNVWLSLSHCGDDAPGLDVVPRRIDEIVTTGTEGAQFEWSVSDTVANQAAGDAGILRPIFEPGDVVLFDDRFLHRTAVEPDMPNTRYAIESWFFGPTGFPSDYTPIGF